MQNYGCGQAAGSPICRTFHHHFYELCTAQANTCFSSPPSLTLVSSIQYPVPNNLAVRRQLHRTLLIQPPPFLVPASNINLGMFKKKRSSVAPPI